MVLGLDAIIGAVHTEIARYRDKRDEEKKKIRDSFISIKTVLNTAIIKIELCKEFGYHKPSKLKFYIPDITLEVNQIAIETREVLGIDIYNGLMILAKFLVDFNEKINSLTLGVSIREDISELLRILNELMIAIEEIEKK